MSNKKLVPSNIKEFIRNQTSKVNENDSFSFIKFKKSPQDLKNEYPYLFSTLSFSIIANALQNNLNKSMFVNNKLDLNRLFNFIKKYKGYKKDFKEFKNTLIEISPILGITDSLKLSREEKSNLKFKEKILSGESDLSFFDEAEIPATEANNTDYVVRSMYGETEPAYYRFDRILDTHEINMLKASYAIKYGDPEKSPYINYMSARPARLGFIHKHGRSIEHTHEYGDFMEKNYN